MPIFRLKPHAALLLAAALVLLLAVAGCGGGDDDESGVDATPIVGGAGQSPGANPLDNVAIPSGEIIVDGSSTVFPISQAVAEEFGKEHGDVQVNVAFSGTGGGFEKFCNSEIDIVDASRPMKTFEKENCDYTDPVEIQVAIDALTIVLNPENDWVDCMHVLQLHEMWKDGGAHKWSDLDPTWPDEDINFYYPGADSGTFEYFTGTIVQSLDIYANHRGDGTSSEDDNIIAQGVENDKYGVGYFGYAYYQGAGSHLKALEIDSGGGCVAPSAETAIDMTYVPLSRPLFIYTRLAYLKDPSLPILGFVKYYLDNSSVLVPETGYVQMPDELLETQYFKLERLLTE